MSWYPNTAQPYPSAGGAPYSGVVAPQFLATQQTPPTTSTPLLPMSAAYAPPSTATYPASTADPSHKRPYSSSTSAASPSKFARGGAGGSQQHPRNGFPRGLNQQHQQQSNNQTGVDLSRYLTPVNANPATSNSNSSSTDRATSAEGSSSTDAPAGPTYCQNYMHNLCHLRSSDAKSSTDDDSDPDETDPAKEGASSDNSRQKPIPAHRAKRCTFIHDPAFRRSFLARTHFVHTRWTQTHKDQDASHKGGRHRGRGKHGQYDDDEENNGTDGKLPGLKPPVAESALLRKLWHEESRVDTSRILQAVRYLVSHNCLKEQRDAIQQKQKQAEEEYQRSKALRSEPEIVS